MIFEAVTHISYCCTRELFLHELGLLLKAREKSIEVISVLECSLSRRAPDLAPFAGVCRIQPLATVQVAGCMGWHRSWPPPVALKSVWGVAGGRISGPMSECDQPRCGANVVFSRLALVVVMDAGVWSWRL